MLGVLRRLAELNEPRVIDAYEREVSRLVDCEIREGNQNKHTQGSRFAFLFP
jgi:hypothetical protein